MRKTLGHEGEQTTQLVKEAGVKDALVSDRWLGYFKNEIFSCGGEERERFFFFLRVCPFCVVTQQRRVFISGCRPPASSWMGFVCRQMSTEAETLLSASPGGLYNVLIDFCLGITGTTSTSAAAAKDHSAIMRECVRSTTSRWQTAFGRGRTMSQGPEEQCNHGENKRKPS